jgi:heterodisulfide reductase subunit A-like polyferredoxin
VVDVPAVQEYAATLPDVVFTDSNLFTCSQDTQEKIKGMILQQNLNRVIVASCSPKTHEGMFMETLEACGLNRYLFEMANIRNQNSWIHSKNPDVATRKAKDLVRAAVGRARTLKAMEEKRIPVNQKALVVGGGVAGMTAALSLERQGFPVVLVEKAAELGGLARRLHHTIEGADVQAFLAKLVGDVQQAARIEVLTGAEVVGFGGYKGNFTTEVSVGGARRSIDHGAIVVATGAVEYRPTEYLYGDDPRVVTQLELSDRLADKGASDLDTVVMIQCVGSRNDEMQECSRVCCQNAVKNALEIKQKNPDTQVFVLYRDIRTYGQMEDYYQEARDKGVIFIRFKEEEAPVVEKDGDRLVVKVKDHILQRAVEIDTDLVTLSAGMRAAETEQLCRTMKLNTNLEKYFMEAHVKLRPVDMPGEGVFLCGTAHGPKLVTESISQAQAAASRATTFLAKPEIKLSAITAKVNTDHCVRCLTCVRNCPFEVPVFHEGEKLIKIDEAMCHGCGVCACVCPRQTIQLSFYEDDQLASKVDALLAEITA